MSERFVRKVIKIRAQDSPNVRLAEEQIRHGLIPTDEIVVEGVLPWSMYQTRRKTWDKVRQCIGLDAEFWEGASVLLYPPDWLNNSEKLADEMKGRKRYAKAIGCDPAEGGDKSSWSVVDEFGLLELLAIQTPDTTTIPSTTKMLQRKWDVPWENVMFDRGGGGKQHADRLRLEFPQVRTIAFGEPLTPEPKTGRTQTKDRKEQREERYAYFNRRAEMYGELRELLDPAIVDVPRFAIPNWFPEIRRQMALIPLTHDQEGRRTLLPKSKKRRADGKEGHEQTLTELIGHSPDELDSLVIAIHAMLNKTRGMVGGAY